MTESDEMMGIDIGNVIINHRLVDKNDINLYENQYSTIPATNGVFEVLNKLNIHKFHGNIFLISKCTPWAQEKILTWLKDNDFYSKTGIRSENVFFCRERGEKNKICKDNCITHFIDDRLEVLSYMVGNVPNLYLYQPDQLEVEEYNKYLPMVTRIESWDQLLKILLSHDYK